MKERIFSRSQVAAAATDGEAADTLPWERQTTLKKGSLLQNKIFMWMKLGTFLKMVDILYVHFKRQENVPAHKASKERLTLIFGGKCKA